MSNFFVILNAVKRNEESLNYPNENNRDAQLLRLHSYKFS